MRVLFTTTPAPGHLHPLVPLAHAAVAAGHEVAFATGASMVPAVEAMGFRAFPAGLGRDGDGDEEFRKLKEAARGLPPVGVEMDRIAVAGVLYGVRTRRMAPDLVALAERWRPDIMVRDSYEAGAAVAAERLGIPHAALDTTPLYTMEPLREQIAAELARARSEAGLAPDDGLGMLHRHLTLSCAPPGYLWPGTERPATARALRPMPFDRMAEERLPGWIEEPADDRPLVYVTFGTITNRWVPGAFPDLFREVLAGLAEEPVRVVATVDRDADPAELGPQPPHIRVERYVPQSLLLPRCAVALSHGGFNTVVGAVDAGLPQVIIPFLGDHPDNARRCAELGIARVLERERVTAAAVREAVRDVLDDPGYRTRIQPLTEELHALPGPAEAVSLLAELSGAA
ncbi:glycosyltransferase [Streptomyces sanyensis]|uniref:Glycosyltransferase n=1 Tax=Streptomyces sanyensis TaxID=568869 RepID=A0ABP9A2B8_9ACTN